MKRIIPAFLIMFVFAGFLPVKADVVIDWNDNALQAIRVDATAPPIASRALAITHAAIFDSVNSIYSTYTPYQYKLSGYSTASPEAAVAAAGYTSLAALFPSQQASLLAQYNTSLASISGSEEAKNRGVTLGTTIANNMLTWRAVDGWNAVYNYSNQSPGTPGAWQKTPQAYANFLLPQWGFVTPFAMTSKTQFPQPPPPDLTSSDYKDAFDRVKDLGAATGSSRTPKQTNTAWFWADGPGTYTPPGHWNAIAQTVSQSEGSSLNENARTFALLNLALGDAGITAWYMKLTNDFWRPVTGIQAADDTNPNTVQDPNWLPLVDTPPFPSYVSGHSTFSGAAAAILADLFGDNTPFSDTTEYTGSGWIDPESKTRKFSSFTEAMEEAGISRIYGGIHWDFDNVYGLEAGKDLGNYVFANYLVPVPLPGALIMSVSGLFRIVLAVRRRMR